MRRARRVRNELGRPWGDRGPTPQDVWQRRKPITSSQRRLLRYSVDHFQNEERTRRGVSKEAVLGDAAQASIDRVAIRIAMERLGQLNITRRLVTPPIKRQYAARFP
jgi:hypothetical protein